MRGTLKPLLVSRRTEEGGGNRNESVGCKPWAGRTKGGENRNESVGGVPLDWSDQGGREP